MNYHIIIFIKAIIGIITLVLILFFVNPYQDYFLAISGLLIGSVFVLRAFGYALTLTIYMLGLQPP